MRKWREINYLRVQIFPITKLIRNKNISFIYKRNIFFLGMSSVMVASHIVLPVCFLNEYNTFLLIIVTMITTDMNMEILKFATKGIISIL